MCAVSQLYWVVENTEECSKSQYIVEDFKTSSRLYKWGMILITSKFRFWLKLLKYTTKLIFYVSFWIMQTQTKENPDIVQTRNHDNILKCSHC